MKPDWSTAPEWAMFAAMDYDRQWCWHSHEPRLSGKVWMPPEDGTWKRASELDQRDWRDTLDRRTPEPAVREDAFVKSECVFCDLNADHRGVPCTKVATPDSTAAGHAGAFDVRRVRAFLPPRPACYGNTFKGVPLQYSEANAIGFLHDALDEIERLRRLSRREG